MLMLADAYAATPLFSAFVDAMLIFLLPHAFAPAAAAVTLRLLISLSPLLQLRRYAIFLRELMPAYVSPA